MNVQLSPCNDSQHVMEFRNNKLSCDLLRVMMQISTSVKQATEGAVLMPAAPTMWVVSNVPVYLDTPEMDSPVQVG